MEIVESLLTVAEISIAVAGFSGVIATFQLRQIEHVSRGRVVAVWMIVNISLFMALFCALPFVLVQFALEDKSVWAISSALLGVYGITIGPFVIRNMRLRREKLQVRILFTSLPIIGVALVVVNFLNSLGIIFSQEAGPFLALVVFLLSLACYNFARLMMRPLWKMVNQREAMSSSKG